LPNPYYYYYYYYYYYCNGCLCSSMIDDDDDGGGSGSIRGQSVGVSQHDDHGVTTEEELADPSLSLDLMRRRREEEGEDGDIIWLW